MAPYDSDSSGGEDDDYTETNVLLGYASADANGEEISRLGGNPDWLDADKPPSAALARCKSCKEMMVLLMQLNAELPDRFPGHERRVYIFGCKSKSCRRKEGSIRAIRGLRASAEPVKEIKETTQPKETPAPKPASQGLGEALFGVKPPTASGPAPRANPFMSSSSTPAANPFDPKAAAANPFSKPQPTPEAPKPDTTSVEDLPKTFAETLTLNNPQTTSPPPAREPWPSTSALPTPFPIRWLADADYETLDNTPPPIAQATATMDMDIEPASSSAAGGKEDKDIYESSMDSTFQKFADRVGQNPEQCIRYEFAGQPLLYAKGDAVGKMLYQGGEGSSKVVVSKGMPRCGNCGAGRVFEVQLMPPAIEELESEEEGMEGMDWGTVIVGVCERDCQERGVGVGEAGYVEEWAGVQWEELTARR